MVGPTYHPFCSHKGIPLYNFSFYPYIYIHKSTYIYLYVDLGPLRNVSTLALRFQIDVEDHFFSQILSVNRLSYQLGFKFMKSYNFRILR